MKTQLALGIGLVSLELAGNSDNMSYRSENENPGYLGTLF